MVLTGLMDAGAIDNVLKPEADKTHSSSSGASCHSLRTASAAPYASSSSRRASFRALSGAVERLSKRLRDRARWSGRPRYRNCVRSLLPTETKSTFGRSAVELEQNARHLDHGADQRAWRQAQRALSPEYRAPCRSGLDRRPSPAAVDTMGIMMAQIAPGTPL